MASAEVVWRHATNPPMVGIECPNVSLSVGCESHLSVPKCCLVMEPYVHNGARPYLRERLLFRISGVIDHDENRL
jgi:hypothetical protein